MKTNQLQKNIPTGWQQLKLGDCLVIKHGKPQKEIEVVGGKYPILATGGIIGRTNTPLYSKPSVLIGRKGTIDKPRYMDTPFWTVDTLFYSHIKENSIAKYLFYKFNTIKWYDYNEASGVPSLSASTISKIKINLPPILEQNRIVSVIETWDKSIEKLILKIEIKKQIKKGLMQDLLTGKKRLSGFKDKWEIVKLGDLIIKQEKTNRQSGHSLDTGMYPFFNNSSKGFDQYLNEFDFDGEMLIANTGGVAYFDYYFGKFAVMSDCFVFTSKENCKFLFYILKRLEDLINHKGFTGSGIKHLDKKFFFKLKIELPSIKEQVEIADIITIADGEIKQLEKKLSLIKDQKRYLLNNLITGTIRTPENLLVKVK